MSVFVPQQFSKLGKKVGDLFKKQYDFDHQIATKHKASNGVTVEAGAKNSTNGFSKLEIKNKDYGNFELETFTESAHKAKITLNTLADGLELILSGNSSGSGGVETSYAADFFALNAALNTNGTKSTIKAAGTIGADDVTCGGAVELDDSGKVKNYDMGCEWAQPDFTLSCFTMKSGDEIHLGYFQKVSSATSVGALFFHAPEDDIKKLTFGCEHAYDASTNVKAKIDTNGILSSVLEHRLSNPNVLLGIAAEYNATKKGNLFSAPQKFGVSLKFGDY